jgi:hypothetical protein
MLKLVSVPNGDYKVKVGTALTPGEIILDPGGNSTGEVVIKGNLVVEGNTSTIESTITTIKDPIITLNEGDPGPGVSFEKSGLHINRGAGVPDSYLTWDETLTWTDFQGVSHDGAFNSFTEEFNGQGQRIEVTQPIKTSGLIASTGHDIVMQGFGTTGVVRVYNNQYAEVIDSRSAGFTTGDDDDILTNKAYVDWKIGDYVNTVGIPSLAAIEFDPITGQEIVATRITVRQEGVNAWTQNSQIDWKINGNEVFRATAEDGFEFYATDGGPGSGDGLRIKNTPDGTLLESFGTNTNLTLSVTGSGSVVVTDDFLMVRNAGDPALPPPGTGTKLYAAEVGGGGTGLYAATEEGRDELASRRKAIIYGLLF